MRAWQLFLLGRGLALGTIDGIFGSRTELATKRFQRQMKLDDDGIVHNRTFGAAMRLGFVLLEDTEDDRQDGPNWPPRPAFEPLTNNAERQRQFGPLAFELAPTPGNPGAIRILNDWKRTNLIEIKVPQLSRVRDGRTKVLVHRLVAERFRELWAKWEHKRVLDRVLTWHGAFVPRLIRGKTVLSNHAFGTAFDINMKWNRLGHQPALVREQGSVRELVPFANELGFYWGGHYRGRLDGMHFELGPLD